MAYNNFLNQQNQSLGGQFSNHLFPQPNGNVYTINSSNELSNIPVGVGLTVVLCMAENTLFLKSIQNGNPVVWSYRISSIEDSSRDAAPTKESSDEVNIELAAFEKRLTKLEKKWEDIFDERIKS